MGALKPDNFAPCSKWIDNHPIDLRSNHPDIQQQDFFLMDLEEHAGRWDVISLSLVVNFVPEPRDRGSFISSFPPVLKSINAAVGRMLLNAFTMLREDGLLFVAVC